MDISYIAIGSELLNGKTQDKNGFWLSKFCTQNGYNLKHIHLISDSYEQLESVLDLYKNDTTSIIISGGLGPTKDDQTKEFLSLYFSCPIEQSSIALEVANENYSSKDRTYPPEYRYDFIPSGFAPLKNEFGFAPGLFFKTPRLQIFSLPGVPNEFSRMVETNFKISIERKSTHLTFKTFKLGESNIWKEKAPTLWDDLSKYGEVASLPHQLGVDISVDLNDIKNKDEVIKIVNSTSLKDYIWHIGDKSIEEVIIQKAIDKKITFGFVESCTGGLLASRITDISGCSSVFYGSIITYDNSVKENCVHVSRKTLKDHGAVSTQIAKEMADGARKQLGVDIVISTTGIAGPTGGSEEKPVGTIYIGASTKNNTEATKYNFKGDRISLKQKFSQMALFTLLEQLND